MTNENDGFINFQVTVDDLDRLEKWLDERKRCATLEELTRRVIRGRLLYGPDTSPSVLPEWVKAKHVLSWNEQESWHEGCQVLVARNINGVLIPTFGILNKITKDTYFIKTGGGIQKYDKVKPGGKEAKTYFENVNKMIWKQGKQAGSIEEQIDHALLKNGAQIASQIQNTLEHDKRFIFRENCLFLQSWIPDLPRIQIKELHRKLVKAFRQDAKTHRTFILKEMRFYFPDLPAGEFGDIALEQALAEVPDLFVHSNGKWELVLPPTPHYNEAVGIYYVYDPATCEILLKPGEKLTKKTADRLNELGFYAQVVEATS